MRADLPSQCNHVLKIANRHCAVRCRSEAQGAACNGQHGPLVVDDLARSYMQVDRDGPMLPGHELLSTHAPLLRARTAFAKRCLGATRSGLRALRCATGTSIVDMLEALPRRGRKAAHIRPASTCSGCEAQCDGRRLAVRAATVARAQASRTGGLTSARRHEHRWLS